MFIPAPSIVSWPHQPMVRVLLLFFGGIIIPEFCDVIKEECQIIICWLLISVVLFRLGKKKKAAASAKLLNGIFISCLVILTGSICSTFRNPVSWPDHFTLPHHKITQTFLVKILPEPVKKHGDLKFNAEIIAVKEHGEINRRSGGLRVIVKNHGNISIRTGDDVWVNGIAAIADESFLPGTFNMRKWMAQEGIEQIITVSGPAVKIKKGSDFNIRRLAIDWRKSLINKLSENGLKGNELAVASALILGERSEIDREILMDYSSSGIVHILAVSGLHVGLIYAGLLLLLAKSRRLKNSWTGALICLSALWLYAMMTGLSASVLRAAVMYSFIAISSVRKVSLSPFNALSASAFLLLVFDPWIWKNTGFQLSYAAVWGIMSFQKPLLGLFNPKWRLVRYLYESITISIAAQVSTSPLTFYIFGSFPVYFLAANLIAIPFSTLLTYTGIAAIILADVPFLGELLAVGLGLGIRFLNGIAELVSSLPNASATNLFISFYGMILSGFFLLQLSLIIQHFTVKRLTLGLLFMLLVAGESLYRRLSFANTNEMVLFTKNGNLQLLHIRNGEARHFNVGSQPVSKQPESQIQLFLRNSFGINNSSGKYSLPVNTRKDTHFFTLSGVGILLMDSHVFPCDINRQGNLRYKDNHADIILVARKACEKDKEFIRKAAARVIVLTSYIKKSDHQAWKDIARSGGIKFLDFPLKTRIHIALD